MDVLGSKSTVLPKEISCRGFREHGTIPGEKMTKTDINLVFGWLIRSYSVPTSVEGTAFWMPDGYGVAISLRLESK